jgi:hypothetical protein
MVIQYFSEWIENTEQRGLPGKADILPFLNSHSDISSEWTVVRTKILNEKMAFAKKKQLMLEELAY